MNTDQLLHLLRSSWWKLALGALVGALVALLLMTVLPKQYEATSSVLIQAQAADPQEASGFTSAELDEMLPTTIALAQSDDSVERTRALLGSETTAETVREDIAYAPAEDAPVITVTATASTPAEAARRADAGAQTAVESVADQTPMGVRLVPTITQKAAEPESAASPNLLVLLPAGIIAGALLVLVWLLARRAASALPRRVRALAGELDAPLLGAVGQLPSDLQRAVAAAGVPTSVRGVRARLARLTDRPLGLIEADGASARGLDDADGRERAHAQSMTVRATLDDGLAQLPPDAAGVLVLPTGATTRTARCARRACESQGVDLVGWVLASRGAGTDNGEELAEMRRTVP